MIDHELQEDPNLCPWRVHDSSCVVCMVFIGSNRYFRAVLLAFCEGFSFQKRISYREENILAPEPQNPVYILLLQQLFQHSRVIVEKLF